MPIFSYPGSTFVKGYPTVYFSPHESRSLMKSKRGGFRSHDGFSIEAKMTLSNRRSERSISSTTQRFDDPTISPCRGHQDALTECLNLPLSHRTTEHRIEIPIGSAKILPFFPKNRPLNRTDLQYDSCYCAFGRLVRFSCSKYTYRVCYSVPFLWIAKNFRKYFWRQKTPFFRTKAARRHFFLQTEKPERPLK
jgi:hypothetical protein